MLNLFKHATYKQVLEHLKDQPQHIQEGVVCKLFFMDVCKTLDKFPVLLRKEFCLELVEKYFTEVL